MPTKPPIGTPINREHPRASGLVVALVFSERGGVRVFDSARRQDGILNNGPVWTAEGLSFDGSDDFIDLGDLASVDFGDSDFSIVARIKPSGITARQMIVGKDSNTLGRQFIFNISDLGPDGHLTFGWATGGSFRLMDTAGAVTAGEWNTVVAQRVGTGLAVWKNGQQLPGSTRGAAAGAMDATSAPLCVGRREYTTAQDFFAGGIDYVYIYRRALKDTEIRQLYVDPYCFLRGPEPIIGKAPSGTIYNDSITESVTASESSTCAATFASTINESVTITASSTAIATFVSTLSESGSASESSTSSATFGSSLSEALSISDSETASATYPSSLSESGSISDSKNSIAAFNNAITESASAGESCTGIIGSILITESVSAGDSCQAVIVAGSSITESVTATESSSATGGNSDVEPHRMNVSFANRELFNATFTSERFTAEFV